MFDPKKPQHFPPAARLHALTPTESEFREAAKRVLAHNWADEMADFNEHPDEGHIYHQLRIMHAHLFGRGASPEG